MIHAATARGAWLFGWVRLRQAAAGVRTLAHAPIKLAVLASIWSVLLIGLYLLAYEGIRFVHETAGLGPFLLSRLWFLFLFVVMIMLAVSQVASAYSTLVRSPETRWWMALPVPARTLARVKWLESSWYSAWAGLLLLLPMSLAHLIVLRKPLWLVGWLSAALFLPLIGIVTALATIALLVWLRWMGRVALRRELWPVGLVAAGGICFWLLGEQRSASNEDAWFLALQALLPHMQIAMAGWLPSSWAATAFDAMLNGRWMEGAVYAALLWTTALVGWRLLDHAAAVWLLPVLRQHAEPSWNAAVRRAPAARGMRISWWMARPFAAALMKDLMLLARDPLQWSQAVVFFGLLGAYFSNIHRLAHFSGEASWRVGIAALNLACTLLVFGSLAVRFLFPQMSVEGKTLWLLRVTPHGLRRAVAAKLALYGTAAIMIIDGLLALSAARLAVPVEVRWWLAGAGLLAAITLVALTVGCGAWLADPTAQDAARVVSSSSGALVLVVMMGYVGCVVAALVVAWSAWTARAWGVLWMSSGGLVLVSLLAGWIPIRKGLERLDRLEQTV